MSSKTILKPRNRPEPPGPEPVLDTLRLTQIPVEAARLRREMKKAPGQDGYDGSRLPVLGTFVQGSHNIVVPVNFQDETRWVFRVPIKGTSPQWDKRLADELVSEVATLQLIGRCTSIPVPEVYGYSATVDNPISCPHIFMSFLPGIPLRHIWMGRHGSTANLPATRKRILEQIAAAMVQLGQFSFKRGGRVLFENREPAGVGSFRMNYFSPSFEVGPFEEPSEFYRCAMDQHPIRCLSGPLSIGLSWSTLMGEEKLLQLFIDCISEFESEKTDALSEGKFVLMMHSFSPENFLVSPQGDLIGVLGWDEVFAWPKSLGNTRYPTWLTWDWDPTSIRIAGLDGDPFVRNLCNALTQHREVYRKATERILLGKGFSTGATLITEAVHDASKGWRARTPILMAILRALGKTLKPPFKFDTYTVCRDLGDDTFPVDAREHLRKGFMQLLRREDLSIGPIYDYLPKYLYIPTLPPGFAFPPGSDEPMLLLDR